MTIDLSQFIKWTNQNKACCIFQAINLNVIQYGQQPMSCLCDRHVVLYIMHMEMLRNARVCWSVNTYTQMHRHTHLYHKGKLSIQMGMVWERKKHISFYQVKCSLSKASIQLIELLLIVVLVFPAIPYV